MTILLSVDPAKPGGNVGLAAFRDGVLLHCWLGAEHCPIGFDALVIELPQVYPGPRNEDPNDLIQVTRTVGWFERIAQESGARTTLVKPRDWKGTVKKEIHNDRVLARLTPAELALLPKLCKSKLHNVIDAIGLGLWKLGRMKP